MIAVGVTGGIGSGKTLLCETWQKMGAEWMNADIEARTLMETDQELVGQIIERFGEKAYDEKGKLNRKYLSREAFENNRIEELNKLVHPAVHRETLRRIEKAKQKGTEVFIKEAALLLKYGRPENLDIIVVVTAPEHLRIKRVAERDGLTTEEVKARITRQQLQSELAEYADYLIENDSDQATFIEQANKLYQKLIQ